MINVRYMQLDEKEYALIPKEEFEEILDVMVYDRAMEALEKKRK